jgi:hypothetical protein
MKTSLHKARPGRKIYLKTPGRKKVEKRAYATETDIGFTLGRSLYRTPCPGTMGSV